MTLLPLAPLRTVDLTDVAVLLRELIVLENARGIGLDLILPLLAALHGHIPSGGFEPCLEGPFRPDLHTMLQQEADVGVPAQEPDELDGDRLKVHLLRREQRE